MSNYKRTNHETSTEFIQEINEDLHYVVPVDTSVQAILKLGGVPAITPNYSGDITDRSYSSLMELRAEQSQTMQDIAYFEEQLKTPSPEPTKPNTVEPTKSE